MMRLIVEGLHPTEGNQGTVMLLLGHEEDGTPHTFVSDWRPARDILEAVSQGEHIEVVVENWQVIH